MALEFPIEIDGKEIIAELRLPVDRPDAVVVPGYDVDTELAALELGFKPSPVAVLGYEWRLGLPTFLANAENLETFLESWSEQSDALPELDATTLGKVLNETARIVVQEDPELLSVPMDLSEFFPIVVELFPQFKRTKWDQAILWEHLLALYEDDQYEVLAELDEVTDRSLFSLTVANVDCEPRGLSAIDCEMEVQFVALDGDGDSEHWVVRATGAFRDAELEEWELTKTDYSEEPEDWRTEDFLERMGEDTDWIAVLEYEATTDPPFDVPLPDGDGDFAVFINDSLYGRFSDSEDAQLFVDMSDETIRREGLGDSVGLYELAEGVDPEESDFDEYDSSNWDQIG